MAVQRAGNALVVFHIQATANRDPKSRAVLSYDVSSGRCPSSLASRLLRTATPLGPYAVKTMRKVRPMKPAPEVGATNTTISQRVLGIADVVDNGTGV